MSAALDRIRMQNGCMLNGLNSLLVVLTCALTCACGSSVSTGGPHSPHHSAGTSQSQTSDGLDPDMVAGVSAGGADPPIGLKFLVDTRPVVGVPLQLKLALIPTAGAAISHVHGTLPVADGLQLQSERTFDVDALQSGAPVQQEVTVMPQRAGVLSLSATLEIDYDNGSIARTYAIPLIASNAS
jgi:hypothetical protein